jgi:hypothetical protein
MEEGERESDRVEYSFGHVADEMALPETAGVNRSVEEEGSSEIFAA